MKFVVVGLGSMGKRRIRNLMALGYRELAGIDVREDRRVEAEGKYQINTFAEFDEAIEQFRPDVLIVSTGPSEHMHYANEALRLRIPCFIEASVVDGEMIEELHHKSLRANVVIVPSCTMKYAPGVKIVKELVTKGVIGKPLNINYQHGQYLPDWHPWESVKDFYVSQRDTGGAREILPFELTWINDIFGLPIPISCLNIKLSDIDVDIDDVYHCLLAYPDGLLVNITIEVVSRPEMTREFRLLGTTGTIVYSDMDHSVKYRTVGDKDWTRVGFDEGTKEPGYINPEEPYIEEMADFMLAVKNNDRSRFPNTLLQDSQVLKILCDLEKLGVPRQ